VSEKLNPRYDRNDPRVFFRLRTPDSENTIWTAIKLHEHMADAGYEPVHVGGYHCAWEKPHEDGVLRISSEFRDQSHGLGAWEYRDNLDWAVGRCDAANQWVTVTGLVLADAIHIAALLPAPDPGKPARVMKAKDFPKRATRQRRATKAAA